MGWVEGALAVAGIIIGVPLSIIGILPTKETVVDPLSAGNSVVRIGIGLLPKEHNASNPYPNLGYGGKLPKFRVYNANGEYIGRSEDSGVLGPGQWATVEIRQNGTGRAQQAMSLELRGAADDPVCIAYMSHTWSDGMKVGWLGDMGKFCRRPWYHSKLMVPTTDEGMHNPSCTWFGGNGTGLYATFPTGMRIDSPKFGRLSGGNGDYQLPENPNSLCWPPTTEWFLGHTDVTSSARRVSSVDTLQSMITLLGALKGVMATQSEVDLDIDTANASWRDTLIASNRTSHSAKQLCASQDSWGPDFISLEESLFCDMSTKTTWPLCNEGLRSHCFDANTYSLVDSKLRKRDSRYSRVDLWS